MSTLTEANDVLTLRSSLERSIFYTEGSPLNFEGSSLNLSISEMLPCLSIATSVRLVDSLRGFGVSNTALNSSSVLPAVSTKNR